ncbi:MAG: hypothetical protein EA390_10540 [Balneolaceae bacterium]|nr:MAG: hypothetical protein EA390_10540 [Balneolaceae bacterium]
MDFTNDKHLDVCHHIEIGLRREYELHTELTDLKCILALENAKISIKKEFGYAKNERVINTKETQGIIDWCVNVGLERIDTINNLTLKEYVDRIEKIRKSVIRHSKFGRRGYYNFIKNYV